MRGNSGSGSGRRPDGAPHCAAIRSAASGRNGASSSPRRRQAPTSTPSTESSRAPGTPSARSALEVGRVAAVAQRGDVVGQRVEPHIHHLAGVAGHPDPPTPRTRHRPGHTEILQPTTDEPKHLIAPRRRLHPQHPRLDQPGQPPLVARQAKEPVLLSDQPRLHTMLRAATLHQLRQHVEPLATHAVPALVAPAVQITAGLTRTPQPLHTHPVARIAGGPDEIIERQTQRTPQRRIGGGVAVHQLPHRHALRLGRLHVLQRIVIGARQEPHRLATPAAVPRQHVGLHDLQPKAKVRPGIHVGDRGGHIEPLAHRSLLPLPSAPSGPNESRPRPGPRISSVQSK